MTVIQAAKEYILARPALWILAAAFAAYTTSKYLWAYYRLRHIKGPWLAGFSDLWLMNKTLHGKTFEDIGRLCQTQGPLVRIAPNYISCGDPAEIRRLWAARSGFDRAKWYQGFRLDPPHDVSISMCDAEAHTVFRSKLAPGYSGRGVTGLHEAIDAGILQFVELIETKYISTEKAHRPVDMARKIQYLTLDIIAQIAFGETLNFMSTDSDSFGYIEQAEASMRIFQVIALQPWILSVLQSPLLSRFPMPSATDTVGLGRIKGIANNFVAKRFGPDKTELPDMLGSFLQHGVTRREAEAESLLQVIAGSDTTASALRTTLIHLLTNPPLYHRLQSEIDTAIASGHISSPVITDTEARQLPLLQATLKEGLRIWPPIHGIMPRVSKTDATICGVRVPAGTNVCWSAWAVLRDKNVFGEDADVFRPERWLRAAGNEKQLVAMNGTLDLCFGGGQWSCLGRAIAQIELNKIIVEMLRRWDFTIVDAARPIKNEYSGLIMQSDLLVRIEKRAV
ncbi:cytochrome P450 [Echria macrotheca]|uniref:Cytochrome P450 n=1 Tax=Echria macrotheca TaxID=438768 RepID=A0AAJ0BE73_9PEZI|nr:cytochrome P450 [Echria macrotheca]